MGDNIYGNDDFDLASITRHGDPDQGQAALTIDVNMCMF